jgi:hypothetical protein
MMTGSRAVVGVLLAALPALAAVGARARPSRGPVTLAKEGAPAATIVTARDAAPAARFAARELQWHLQRVTGATLPIVDDAAPDKGLRILVGDSAAARRLGYQGSRLAGQSYLVRVARSGIVLLGRDDRQGDKPAWDQGIQPPATAKGRFGRGRLFDGNRNMLTIPYPGISDDEGTLEAWVSLASDKPDADGTILRVDGSGPWSYHILQQLQNENRVQYRTYDGATVRTVESEPLAPGWHHVMATYSVTSGKIELVVDGASAGTAPYGRTHCAGCAVAVGGVASAGVGNPFGGVIDDVRISSVARRPEIDGPQAPLEADEATTALLHLDEPGEPMDSSGRPAVMPLPSFFGNHGTLSAVYDFLERCCEVRWYLPGELGMVCPRRPTLSLRPVTVRRAPDMAYRWITPTSLLLPTPATTVEAREADLWKLRMRLGGEPFSASHSFYGYYSRFLKTHPEWFAQGYEGQPPQMCYTNPGFVRQVVQDARDAFSGKGAPPGAMAMGDMFALCPMDNNQWCKCPTCQAALNRSEEANKQFNNGRASEYIWGFVNRVAREVRKTHPKGRIVGLAYWEYAYAPKQKLEPNVVPMLCLHVRNWWCPSMEANDRKVLTQYTSGGRLSHRPVYLWLYYNFPALLGQSGKFNVFPGYFAKTLARQMETYHRLGIRGIFMEHSPEFGHSLLHDTPDMWLTWKLADDPSLSARALVAEFFRRYYGAAEKPMRTLYGAIEEIVATPANYPLSVRLSPAHHHQSEELAWGTLGTPSRMAYLAQQMQLAKAAARTPEEKARVAQFEEGIWLPMVEGAAKWAASGKAVTAEEAPPPTLVKATRRTPARPRTRRQPRRRR